jgi:hypothetical protein
MTFFFYSGAALEPQKTPIEPPSQPAVDLSFRLNTWGSFCLFNRVPPSALYFPISTFPHEICLFWPGLRDRFVCGTESKMDASNR